MRIIVALPDATVTIESGDGKTFGALLPGDRRPACITWDTDAEGRAWCGTRRDGVLVSDDAGLSWRSAGLRGERVTAIACGPPGHGVVWAGTEPSAVYRSGDGGRTWDPCEGLLDLPSSAEWSFPPRPETHHVRWLATHPSDPGPLWVAIEAGALISSRNAGEVWQDRVPGGPLDTHELAIHRRRPRTLRVAAGDGYFESDDGGATWSKPRTGLEVGYLTSIAIDPGDPGVVVVAGASGPRSAYMAGRGDGRLYRRSGDEPWVRVRGGWPDPPATIAPLLAAGAVAGQLVAADERGVHISGDGGLHWERVTGFESSPDHLRGLALEPALA